MSISAAPMAHGGAISRNFATLFSVAPVNASPMKAFDTKAPGQVVRLQTQVSGVGAQVNQAIGQALQARADATRIFGLAGAEQGKASNLLNPAKDAMLMASAAVIPALAPVVSALALANVLSYMKADRNGKKAGKQAQGRFEDIFRSSGSSIESKGAFGTDWNKTGYQAPMPANDTDDISLKLAKKLETPLEQDRDFQRLLGQRTQSEGIQAANENRAEKGVPLSRDTLEAALDMDSDYLNAPDRFHRNLPGNEL